MVSTLLVKLEQRVTLILTHPKKNTVTKGVGSSAVLNQVPYNVCMALAQYWRCNPIVELQRKRYILASISATEGVNGQVCLHLLRGRARA